MGKGRGAGAIRKGYCALRPSRSLPLLPPLTPTLSPCKGSAWGEGGSLKHGGVDAVGGGVAVEEGFDVDDDLFAHVDAAFDGC